MAKAKPPPDPLNDFTNPPDLSLPNIFKLNFRGADIISDIEDAFIPLEMLL